MTEDRQGLQGCGSEREQFFSVLESRETLELPKSLVKKQKNLLGEVSNLAAPMIFFLFGDDSPPTTHLFCFGLEF